MDYRPRQFDAPNARLSCSEIVPFLGERKGRVKLRVEDSTARAAGQAFRPPKLNFQPSYGVEAELIAFQINGSVPQV